MTNACNIVAKLKKRGGLVIVNLGGLMQGMHDTNARLRTPICGNSNTGTDIDTAQTRRCEFGYEFAIDMEDGFIQAYEFSYWNCTK